MKLRSCQPNFQCVQESRIQRRLFISFTFLTCLPGPLCQSPEEQLACFLQYLKFLLYHVPNDILNMIGVRSFFLMFSLPRIYSPVSLLDLCRGNLLNICLQIGIISSNLHCAKFHYVLFRNRSRLPSHPPYSDPPKKNKSPSLCQEQAFILPVTPGHLIRNSCRLP